MVGTSGIYSNCSRDIMYGIDSDFAIAVLKGVPEASALLEKMETDGFIFISSISVFEMAFTSKGISKKREQALLNFLDTLKVIPLSKEIALHASRIGTQLAKSGKMVHPMDLLIGVTALENGLILVTNNIKHFSRIKDLKVLGW